MKKRITLGLIAFQMIAFNAIATIEINFDTDAYGNPITAPDESIETVRLSELYAPIGVHFWGPDGPDGRNGGAIFDQDGNFGIDARSGRNVLGFNRAGHVLLMDGGLPRDPETIMFDTLASNISIYAGGPIAETFVMQGFDANGMLVATDTITTQGWSELEIAWEPGIKSAQLFVTGPNDTGIPLYFVFDDFSVDFVPEPSSTSFLICAAAVGFVLRFARRKP